MNLDGFIPPKVDYHAMSSEPKSDVFLTPIRIESMSAERTLSSTISTMTVLSNHLDNDLDLVPINQQLSQNPQTYLASNEPPYVALMSTSVVPSSLPDSPLIGSNDTKFASGATNTKQSSTIAIVNAPMLSPTSTAPSQLDLTVVPVAENSPTSSLAASPPTESINTLNILVAIETISGDKPLINSFISAHVLLLSSAPSLRDI